ncbi:MAG: glycosyltransferase family 4 protein [Bacteroidaceae bacterium]|nr:glycosyltransferase family 4 protein [Bacteroidaceae bacterium]
MRIAYFCNYVGDEFRRKYCGGKKFALSGILKSQGIARSLLKAGHEVTIYSPALTVCRQFIPQFTEEEHFEEGILVIKYPPLLSFRKCGPINAIRLRQLIKRDVKEEDYDVFIYYNITFGAALLLNIFKNSIRILEYEDNIFNKNLVGEKNKYNRIKLWRYNYVIPRTDGVMAVCMGMLNHGEVPNRILTPGIINEEVINNVSDRKNQLAKGKPVKIFLTGGTHYSKGSDLLIGAMRYVKTPCSLEIYGNGQFYNKALEELKLVPNYHQVHLNGYLPHGDLMKLLDKEADILINTTRSMGVGAQAAGFPFKMMEYASTGRPIVSSELGKFDEDFNRHVSYYEGENPQKVAEAIEDVIAHYEERVSLALNLQKRVLDEFSISGTSKKLNSFLQSIRRKRCNQ